MQQHFKFSILHPEDRFQKALKTIYALSEVRTREVGPIKVDSLDSSEVTSTLVALKNLMELEAVYLDQDLTLRSLAESVDLHPNKLSWLINEHIGKNFNEYVNTYRLEAFKQRALDPTNSHLTLLGLAYESGFNSKTAFNTVFKKLVGMTPKAFQKSQQ